MLDFLKEEYDSLKQRIGLKQKYVAVFETPEGRRVLHDIIRRAGLYSTSVGQEADVNMTLYREGKRALCLEILSMMRMDNEAAMLALLQERDNRGDQS